jgi:uncharacterized protein (TIGR02145 family)
MNKLKIISLAASLVLAILTLTNCGEVGCDPTRDSWCEENDSSSSIGGGSSSSGGGLPLSSNGGNSSSSVGGGSSSSEDGGGSTCNADFGEVQIGTQIWAAKNLNCNVEGSKCYDNDPTNCTKYGRLYDWSTALTICPSGWHLPSNADWDALMTAVGGENTAGTKLKTTSGWSNGGDGTDHYGFSALPGGGGGSGGDFRYAGIYGRWWSASEYNSYNAYVRSMYYGEGVDRSYDTKSSLFSVRCLQD